jgi:hypothetical protein
VAAPVGLGNLAMGEPGVERCGDGGSLGGDPLGARRAGAPPPACSLLGDGEARVRAAQEGTLAARPMDRAVYTPPGAAKRPAAGRKATRS